VLRIWIAQTPIIVHVPEACVYRIEDCEGDENCVVSRRLVDPIDTECHVEDDGGHVLAQVEEMRKGIASVVVAAKTLDCTPDAGECSKEAKKAGA
jgi:hypothetical protein